jgi:hypothetical protein
MSSRAIHTARMGAKISRDCALLLFSYMRLEKHVRNALSHDLLLAPALVGFDHLTTTTTHSSDIFSCDGQNQTFVVPRAHANVLDS